MAKRIWRKPIEADKQRKCYAYCSISDKKHYVIWNDEWEAWGLAAIPHILVRADKILSAPLEDLTDEN